MVLNPKALGFSAKPSPKSNFFRFWKFVHDLGKFGCLFGFCYDLAFMIQALNHKDFYDLGL